MESPRLIARTALLAIYAAVIAPAALAQTPSVLAAALSPRQDTTTFAYEFTLSDTGSRPMSLRGRIDPSRPEGQRVEILEATGEDVDTEEIDERMEANADGDIWCDSMFSGADGAVTEQPAPAGQRAYAFTPMARPDAESDERKMFSRLSATAIVDQETGALKSSRAVLDKPWKPNIMAKISQFELSVECAMAPNGRAYAETINTKISGSALGQSFTSDNTRRITRVYSPN